MTPLKPKVKINAD